MQEITCKLTPTVLQKNYTMQIQVRRPRVAYADHQKTACLCSLLKLTMRYRAARPRLHAREESTPIQALFAPALKIFLHSARFCYPVCYPVGPVQQPAANYLVLLDRQKRRSRIGDGQKRCFCSVSLPEDILLDGVLVVGLSTCVSTCVSTCWCWTCWWCCLCQRD